MVELKVGEPNDVPGQSTLEPGGCDARARTLHCTTSAVFLRRPEGNVAILPDSTQGLGKQRALLIGQNQTAHVRYNSLQGI